MERAILVHDPMFKGAASSSFHAVGLSEPDNSYAELREAPQGRRYPWYGPARDLDPEALHDKRRTRPIPENTSRPPAIAYDLIGANRTGPFRHARPIENGHWRPEDTTPYEPSHGVKTDPTLRRRVDTSWDQDPPRRGNGPAAHGPRGERADLPDDGMVPVTIRKFNGGVVAPQHSRIPLWEAEAIRSTTLPIGSEPANARGTRPAGATAREMTSPSSRRIQRHSRTTREAEHFDTSMYQMSYQPPDEEAYGQPPPREDEPPVPVDGIRYTVPDVVKGRDNLYRNRYDHVGEPFWFGGSGVVRE